MSTRLTPCMTCCVTPCAICRQTLCVLTPVTAMPSSIAAYRPRVVDGQLAASLEAIGAVLVEGLKACGKIDTPAASQAYAVAAHVRLMVTDDLPAWRPALRSRTRLRGRTVRHLAASLLYSSRGRRSEC